MSRWVRIADLRRRIRIQTIQSSGGLLNEMPADRVLDAFHMVGPGGQVTTGGDAVPTLVEALPFGPGFGRFLRRSEGLMAGTRAAYRFLIRFRDRLACRLDAPPTSAGSVP